MILRSAQHSTQTLCTSVSHIFFIPLNSMNAFPCGLPRKRAFLPLYYIELRVCVWAYTVLRWYKCWSFVKKKRKQDPEMRPYTALLWTTMFKNRRIHKLFHLPDSLSSVPKLSCAIITAPNCGQIALRDLQVYFHLTLVVIFVWILRICTLNS